jgi:hypothetical protein
VSLERDITQVLLDEDAKVFGVPQNRRNRDRDLGE